MNDTNSANLHKVVLLGDSIRIGYTPHVRKSLIGKAQVVSDVNNGEDSKNLLANLTMWAINEQPQVVHFNCGLHDLKRFKSNGHYQVSLDVYEANLKQLIHRLKNETNAKLIFATTTPINDQLHSLRSDDFDRFEEDVIRYNNIAINTMNNGEIEIHDLHRVVLDLGIDEIQVKDGTHYSENGYENLAESVANVVMKSLTTSQ